MSEQSPKTNDVQYSITYAVDRDGNEKELEIKEIPFDVYKAAMPHLSSNPDKALMILINAVGQKGKEDALAEIDRGNLVAIGSMESVFAQLIMPIKGTLKKK